MKSLLNLNTINMALILLISIMIQIHSTTAIENKYSKESNLEVLHLKDPLRMAKLNVVWEKARKRLSEPKLKKLLSELKVQDKEELTLKKLKASGGDKAGLKEAELRKSLSQIIKKYSLNSHDDNLDQNNKDKEIEKGVFKDKKLHKLWLKAEKSGLTQIELRALREEFEHHQEKIEEYYSLIEEASNSPNDVPMSVVTNDIHSLDSSENLEGSAKEYHESINSIRELHRELKNGYVSLHKKSTSGPDSAEFTDPKVASLWKLALRGNFDDVELESLFTELKHYETRLFKLSYLSLELNKTGLAKVPDGLSEEDKEKILSAKETEGMRILEDRLQKQKRKVKKIHEDLELRILARHSEL